jgi:membrane protein YdbS with pleckstrin-like domain
MLTAEEEKFVRFWEQNRAEHSKFSSKLLRGIPMASIFGLPILLLIVCVYFFLPDWYIKVSKTSPQTFVVVVIAVLIVVLFYAFARMHFKWEMNDQLYQELKKKERKTDAANE